MMIPSDTHNSWNLPLPSVPPSQCIFQMQRRAGSATSGKRVKSLCLWIFRFNRNSPRHARVVVREHNRTLATTVRLYGMLPPHVGVHYVKPCLGAGTIRRGGTAPRAISGGGYLAVSRVDDAIKFNARLVLVRYLLQCARGTVAHPPMPHVGVYLRAVDV